MVANGKIFNTMVRWSSRKCLPSASFGGEGVTKETAGKKWTKPALNYLGQLKDVAGPRGVGTQGGPNSKS